MSSLSIKFQAIATQAWINDFRLGLREEGEIFVIPSGKEELIENIEKRVRSLKELGLKAQEMTIQPVKGI